MMLSSTRISHGTVPPVEDHVDNEGAAVSLSGY